MASRPPQSNPVKDAFNRGHINNIEYDALKEVSRELQVLKQINFPQSNYVNYPSLFLFKYQSLKEQGQVLDYTRRKEFLQKYLCEKFGELRAQAIFTAIYRPVSA